MTEQNFSNHRRYVTGYHIILSLLLVVGTICSIVNIIRHPPHSGGFVSSILIALLFVCCLFVFWYMRQFPVKAQDRAIRAEEGLRCFILTGKALDPALTMGQIIALRFAPDDEFTQLIKKAIAENLSPKEIKKSIRSWKADNHRL